MWDKGLSNGYEWEVKHFDEDSVFGIDEGKISKLFIYKDEETVVAYDREWLKKPATKAVKELYNQLVAKFN